jgi:hypothetical protein
MNRLRIIGSCPIHLQKALADTAANEIFLRRQSGPESHCATKNQRYDSVSIIGIGHVDSGID